MPDRSLRGNPIRLGMVGGGQGSFIGPVHRMSALLDARFDLVAGAFSRSAEKSAQQGEIWRIAPDRVHTDPFALFAAEAARPDGIEAVAIVTPNHSHAAIAEAAIGAGIAVICDKPMTATLAQAEHLSTIVRGQDVPFALTYTYTGYAMVREARARVASGSLGAVRKVLVEYPQGWLAERVEDSNPQASWRLDPAQAGAGGTIGDIGVHAFQLLEYVSGLKTTALCADLSSLVDGRILDDDCSILLRLEDHVPAVLLASQALAGERNGLSLRIHCERGSLAWYHEQPDRLIESGLDGQVRTVFAGTDGLSAEAMFAGRLPVGHPEGFIEAFATIYSDFADALDGARDRLDGRIPGITDGWRSIRFIDLAIRSSQARRWLSFDGEQL